MRISDWSSDVCSSDLGMSSYVAPERGSVLGGEAIEVDEEARGCRSDTAVARTEESRVALAPHLGRCCRARVHRRADRRSVVEGTSVSVRVDLGGSRIIKKQQATTHRAGSIYSN